jgi:predicted CXXCH cytochrome family protein
VATLGSACATPEQRYQVLSFFFDGVPSPITAEGPKAVADAEPAAALARMLEPSRADWAVHDPYTEDSCGECHDAGFSNRLIVSKDELCWTCHDREDYPGKVVHGPMQSGHCDGCHNPHRSPFENLLVREPETLCQECHDETTFVAFEEHRAEQGEDCLECHDPHAASREYLLREGVGES